MFSRWMTVNRVNINELNKYKSSNGANEYSWFCYLFRSVVKFTKMSIGKSIGHL